MFKAFGAVESIFFRGVGPGGYDIYGLKFANGVAEFRLLLGADGKADDVVFRPDGNDELGGVVGCSDEAGLRSKGVTAPIRLLIYNGSGGDIQLLPAGRRGKASGPWRDRRGYVVRRSRPMSTVHGSFADASGKCLEIVLPGQRTRLSHGRARAPG